MYYVRLGLCDSACAVHIHIIMYSGGYDDVSSDINFRDKTLRNAMIMVSIDPHFIRTPLPWLTQYNIVYHLKENVRFFFISFTILLYMVSTFLYCSVLQQCTVPMTLADWGDCSCTPYHIPWTYIYVFPRLGWGWVGSHECATIWCISKTFLYNVYVL